MIDALMRALMVAMILAILLRRRKSIRLASRAQHS